MPERLDAFRSGDLRGVRAVAKIPLSPKWCRALEMLAIAGEGGDAEAALIARGFSADMLTSLVRVGFATPVLTSGQLTPWLRITDKGRQVLDGASKALTREA